MGGLETKIKGLSGIKSVESNLDGSTAILNVEHTGTAKEMIDALKASSGNAFKIQKLDANAGKVTIAMN
jgi:copper chaperone CopZ